MIPNLNKDITGRTYLIQLALTKLGHYGGKLDNWRGDATDRAENAWRKKESGTSGEVIDNPIIEGADIEVFFGRKFDDSSPQFRTLMLRSMRNIIGEGETAGLHPKLRPLAIAVVGQFAMDDVIVVITSGTRTYEQQAKLHEDWINKVKGAGTAAAPGYSMHNFALAWDSTLFQRHSSEPIWDSPKYKVMGSYGQSVGLFWGGVWKGKDEDQPHLELQPPFAAGMSRSGMLAELRARHKNKQDQFA